MIRVQTEDFDVGAELRALIGANHAIGGVVTFTGVVRASADDGGVMISHKANIGFFPKQIAAGVGVRPIAHHIPQTHVGLYTLSFAMRKDRRERFEVAVDIADDADKH